MQKKQITFIKWIDPFVHQEEKNLHYKDSYEETEEDRSIAQKRSGPVLVGPLGIIPINEHNQPSKVFNFWMLHSNFNLTKPILQKIEKIAGVESLDVYTRYRCRISIGRIFDEMDVQTAIEKELCSTGVPSMNVAKQLVNIKEQTVHRLQQQLTNKYKYWVIFVLPNGQIDYAYGDTELVVKEKIKSYPKRPEHILKSWEASNEGEINQT